MIVRSNTPVILVGGGPVPDADLAALETMSETLVAADGGADHLLRSGRVPVAVFGDMDSLSEAAAQAFAPQLCPIVEQDSTDFYKALSHIEAPVVLAIGMAGGRFDHALAAMHVLMQLADRPCVVVGPQDVTVLCPPLLALDLPAGCSVSLFPFAQAKVASTGLRWATDHLAFDPRIQIGTSNAAVGGPVTLRAQTPDVVLTLPRAVLRPLIAALSSAARWPARA